MKKQIETNKSATELLSDEALELVAGGRAGVIPGVRHSGSSHQQFQRHYYWQ